MLNKEKIEFLCNLVDLEIRYTNGVPTGYLPREILPPRKLPTAGDIERVKKQSISLMAYDKIYKCLYSEVEKIIGSDIRFNWLLTENLYLAGGSVLNWIWGESKNNDYDFFLTQPNIDFALLNFMKDIGFSKINKTNYADTYSDGDNTLIQIVRLNYDTPENMISRFDINVCKFAVCSEYFYVSRRAVIDLLSLVISPSQATFFNKSLDRYLKYNHKGFFLDKSITKNLQYKTEPEIYTWADLGPIDFKADGEDEFII